MTYEQALSYIHTVSWRGSKPGLSRTRELLQLIGNPQDSLRFIHVAGTNGKGSTCRMLASVLQADGYKVGLYTSPYITRFNERIQVNGKEIPDDALAALTAYMQPLAESMADHPTEFELITALAMYYFALEKCDIVVLEVGLGGELDSTNVIAAPVACVITAMGYDHIRELGPTLSDIAKAKAGIIKPGSPVFSYGGQPEADSVIRNTAMEKGVPVFEPDFSMITLHSADLNGQVFSYKHYKELFIPLAGSYQLKNASLTLEVLYYLSTKGYAISEESIREGLQNAVWPARFEVIMKNPVFIVDGGHNPHGINGTAESLMKLFPSKKCLFLCGILADKDVDTVLETLIPLAKVFYCVTPQNPRALDAKELSVRISAQGCPAKAFSDMDDAISAILADAAADDIICATGSLYMCGEVRAKVKRLYGT